jgi:hypothetical protein
MGKKTAQLSVAEYEALIKGLQTYFTTSSMTVASQTYTGPEAVTFLQSLLTPSAAVSASKAAWHQAVLANAAAESQNGAIAREMRDAIALAYSNAPATLAVFGLTPRKKPTPLTTAARAAAAAKAKATREARGTKGSKQKAAITGNVSGVTITPVLIPSAPATAPASAATSTGAPVPATPVATVATGGATAPAVSVGPVATGTAAATAAHT